MTLQSPGNESQKKNTAILRISNRQSIQRPKFYISRNFAVYVFCNVSLSKSIPLDAFSVLSLSLIVEKKKLSFSIISWRSLELESFIVTVPGIYFAQHFHERFKVLNSFLLLLIKLHGLETFWL